MKLSFIGGEHFCDDCKKMVTVKLENGGEWVCIECNQEITRPSISKAEGGQNGQN